MDLYERKILRYVHPMFKEHDFFPNYLQYGEKKPEETVRVLYESGYIRKCTLEENLSKETLPTLKKFCKLHDLKSSGNKSDIIRRILTYCAENDVEYPLTNHYITTTDIGFEEIKDILHIPMADIDFVCVIKYKVKESIDHFKFEDLSEVEKLFMCMDFSFIWHDNWTEEFLKKVIIAFEKWEIRYDLSEYFCENCYGVSINCTDFFKAKKFLNGIKNFLEIKSALAPWCTHYKIRTMHDERSCEYCKQFEEKPLPIADAQIGVNFPPFYKCSSAACRCYALPISNLKNYLKSHDL